MNMLGPSGISAVFLLLSGFISILAVEEYSVSIEGWGGFGVSHSYAIVEQGVRDALEHQDSRSRLSSRARVTGYFCSPLYNKAWIARSGCNASNLPMPKGGSKRISARFTFPFNVAESNSSSHTFVFATAEYSEIPESFFTGARDGLQKGTVTIVTPSPWSRQSLLNSGVPETSVIVLPHGVDTAVFRPNIFVNRDDRHTARLKFFSSSSPNVMVNDQTQVFLSVGSMTWNKGIDILLKSFVRLYEAYEGDSLPPYLLVLKGIDQLYTSYDFLLKTLQSVHGATTLFENNRIQYIGHELSQLKLAQLYAAADIYVSPYRAEAFNMPIFEAAATGLLVICTDDVLAPSHLLFQDHRFALPVRATVTTVVAYGIKTTCFDPSETHLFQQMYHAANNASLRALARWSGPAYINAYLTWKHVAESFLDRIDNVLYKSPFIYISNLIPNEVIIATNDHSIPAVVTMGGVDEVVRLCCTSLFANSEEGIITVGKESVQSFHEVNENCHVIPRRGRTRVLDQLQCRVPILMDIGSMTIQVAIWSERNGKFVAVDHVNVHTIPNNTVAAPEMYGRNLIEAGHFWNAQLEYSRLLSRVDRSSLEFNLTLIKLSSLVPPIMPDTKHLKKLKVELLENLKNLISADIVIDVNHAYPAEHRYGFDRNASSNIRSTNAYLILPSVFSSYHDVMDYEYRRLAASLVERWVYHTVSMRGKDQEIDADAVDLSACKAGAIKIGFVSTTMYYHSVGKLMLGIIRTLAGREDNFCVFIFAPEKLVADESDFIMHHLKQSKALLKALPANDLSSACEIIRQEDLQIIVYTDLGTDPLPYSMAFVRLATVQAAFWGNPVPPLSPEIDYFLLGEHHKARQEHFRAQLVYLFGIGAYYFRPVIQSKGGNEQNWRHLLRSGVSLEMQPIILVTQALCKVHPHFDEALRLILLENPSACIIFLAGRGSLWASQLKERLKQLQEQHGNGGETWLSRVYILKRLSPDQYANIIASATIMLDTFPYSGFTTSIEALLLGLPILTFPGISPSSSQTAALYLNMMPGTNAEDINFYDCCIAWSTFDYVSKASNLLANASYRSKVRSTIRNNVDQIFFQDQAVASWVQFLNRVAKLHLS